MKKVAMLLAVMMMGLVSAAFAGDQGRLNTNKLSAALERKVAQEENSGGNGLIERILKEGKKTTLNYSITTDDFVLGGTSSAGTAVGSSGYVRNTCHYKTSGYGYWDRGTYYNYVWFLMEKNEWDNMYDKCMPSGVSRFFGTRKIVKEIFDSKVFFRERKSPENLIEHKEVTVKGKKYILIEIDSEAMEPYD